MNDHSIGKNSHTIAAFFKDGGGAEISAVANRYQSQAEQFDAARVIEGLDCGLPSKKARGSLWPCGRIRIITLPLCPVDVGLLGVFRRLLLVLWN